METNENSYFHINLANYFEKKPLYLDEPTHKKPNTRKLVEQPYQQTKGEMWDELISTLKNLFFLEAKIILDMSFDLVRDYYDAMQHIPLAHQQRRNLRLMEEAIRRDIHFITRHSKEYPQALFQCLWNSCWWYDSSEAEKFYSTPDSLSNPYKSADIHGTTQLSEILESWLQEREKTNPEFTWLRSLRPPKVALGNGYCAILNGHQGTVKNLAYSPDGILIASVGKDGLRVWNSVTLRELFFFPTEDKSVETVSFSPDSRLVISVDSKGTVNICDALTGIELKRFFFQDFNGSASISKDAQFIAFGKDDGTLSLYDLTTWKELHSLKAHTGPLTHIQFSNNSDLICTYGHDNFICIHDLESLIEIHRFEIIDVSALNLSADGNMLVVASGSNPKLRVYNITSGFEKMSVHQKEPSGGRILVDLSLDKAQAVVFSVNQLVVITGGGDFDKTLRFWDIENGRELYSIAQNSSVTSIACSPDGKFIAVASSSGDIILFESEISGFPAMVLNESLTQGSQAQVLGNIVILRFSPSGKEIMAGSLNHTSRLFSCTTGQLKKTYFTPLDHYEIFSHWQQEEEILFKKIESSFYDPSWNLLHRNHESVIVETKTNKNIAWFPTGFTHSLIHPTGIIAGANDDNLVLFSLEGKSNIVGQQIAAHKSFLSSLLEKDESEQVGISNTIWKVKELDRGIFILTKAFQLFRQFEETGEIPWPKLNDNKYSSQATTEDTSIFVEAAMRSVNDELYDEYKDSKKTSKQDVSLPSDNATDAFDMPALKNAEPGLRSIALQLMVSMHQKAESIFFSLGNQEAINISRPQRDLLLEKMLDTLETIASNSPGVIGNSMKIQAADSSVENAIFLEERNELDSALVLYKRAERIYRELSDKQSVLKVLEFQLDLLRRIRRGAGNL